MALNMNFVAALVIALCVVGCFRNQVDQCAQSFLLTPHGDNMARMAQAATLERQNKQIRQCWITTAFAIVAAFAVGKWDKMDIVACSYGAIVVPIAWATESTPYGYLAQVAQYLHLVARLLFPNDDNFPNGMWMFWVVLNYGWSEANLSRLSTLFLHHGPVLLTTSTLRSDTATFVDSRFLITLTCLAVGVFWTRRFYPDRCTADSTHNSQFPKTLSNDDRSRCVELIESVLDAQKQQRYGTRTELMLSQALDILENASQVSNPSEHTCSSSNSMVSCNR